MGFQQKSLYKQVTLTSTGALETARLLALGTTSLRPTPLENRGGFSNVTVMLCGRKYEVEKSSTDLMVLFTLVLATLLAFLLV